MFFGSDFRFELPSNRSLRRPNNGASGDMYAGLNEEQRASLKEITRMGFPPRAWWAHDEIAFAATGVYGSIIAHCSRKIPRTFRILDEARISGRQSTEIAARCSHPVRDDHCWRITTAEAKKRGLPVSISAGTRDTAPAGLRLAKVPIGRLQGAFLYPQKRSG